LPWNPKVTLPTQESDVEKVIGASPISPIRWRWRSCRESSSPIQGHQLERLVAEVTDAEINEALDRIVEQNRRCRQGGGAKVEKGDRVVIDFAGKIDGAPFEGGTGGDVGVNVGSATFIPGFEDQLIGMEVGEQRLVKVTFPAKLHERAARREGREST